jgi:pimeloyl-ACP methyl ester carboxylesterase
MTASTQTITLSHGRTVDLFLGGDPNGRPLVMHHGTPSDSTTFADWHDDCAARHLRLICMSRPGYAATPRMAGRSVADIAHLTADLLDQLGHSEFHTAGWSGGGPHALACAALLPHRCQGAAILAGVGPYGEPDLDFLAGMGPENIEEFNASLQGEAALRAWKEANVQSFRSVTGPELAAAFGGLVPPIDQAELTGPYADAMATEMRRALSGGFDGWIDDDLAFIRPWGFDLARITIPISIWQGDLDLMVPHQHATWLAAHIKTAQLHMVPGHGHISLVTRYRSPILDTLLSA